MLLRQILFCIGCIKLFQVLKDKEKKKIYDTYGEEGLQNGAGPSGNTRTFHYNTDPRATFEEFFGGKNFDKLLDEMYIFQINFT